MARPTLYVRPLLVLAICATPVGALADGDLAPGQEVAPIVGGSPVDTCGWPTTISAGGCTGTLIHPKAISTGQHCGEPSSIGFGESSYGPMQSIGVVGCVGDGSQDAMICELAEEVTQLPVTPVLYGCEVDEYLNVGQPVVIAGYGQTSYGQGGGTKLWGDQVITLVEPGRVIIGDPGDPVSPCPGDSGGPVFLQVADGSWRAFGTVLGGTTGTPCNSAADFQRIDQVVPFFEMQRGIDITPCFDAASGDWEAGPDCGTFFAGDHTGSGSWADWCAGTPASGYSDECGEPFDTGGGDDGTGDGSGEDTGGGEDGADATGDGGEATGGEDADGGTDAGDDTDTDGGSGTDETGGSYAGDSDGSGCGCDAGRRPLAPLGLALGLVVLWRRRLR